MERNIKTLGETSARLVTGLAEQGRYYFTTQEAAEFLGTTVGNASKLLSDLRTRHWVVQLAAGKYLLLSLESGLTDLFLGNELVVGSKLVSPYYLSYWTAIHYYGWTEQVPRTVFIATTRKRNPLVFSGHKYQFIKLADKKFFGYQPVWIDANRVEMASPEKLLVDCLDLPRYAGGIKEVAKIIVHGGTQVDWDKVIEYALRQGNGAVVKRLGFLLSVLNEQVGTQKELQKGLSAGYAALDPSLPKDGKYELSWKVQVNLNPDEIVSWRRS